MRIAVVTESFYPAVDATTTTVKAVVDRLVDLGHEVALIAPAPGLTSYRGARVVRITPDGLSARVRGALEELAPDLVHVTSPGRLGRKALKHARRQQRATLVVQQTPLTGIPTDYWRAKVADRADRVLVTAPWLQERLARIDVPSALWSPGVDTAAYTPRLRDPGLHAAWSRAGSPDGGQVLVGYVGSLHRRYGVRSLADLGRVPGIRPVVIGDGPQRGWLEDRLPRAKFTGELEPGDLTRALATLDLLVDPDPESTCCHALRAAAASGVPTVAPRAGGATGVVRPLETGLLYDPTDPRAMAEAVAALAGDRHRGLLGGRARELACLHDWGEAVDELVSVHYRPLLGRREDPPEAA